MLTVRTPEALRPKVLTAVMTISGLVRPLGFLAAGQSLQYVSLTLVFLVVAAGFTVGAVAFSAPVTRGEAASIALPDAGADGKEEADALPAIDLAPVAPVEARAHASAP